MRVLTEDERKTKRKAPDHKGRSADLSPQDKSSTKIPESQQKTLINETKIGKSREWTCLVYPTEDYIKTNYPDCPYDGADGYGTAVDGIWQEQLTQTFLEAWVSPLHCDDVNSIDPDGTKHYKKPHFHVVLAWNKGTTTFDNAKRICKSFGGVIEPREVGSLRGALRYLCHLDNPEKAQYEPKDVKCFNGAEDYFTAIELASDRDKAIEEMEDFCDRYRITSYRVLSMYARKHHRNSWHRMLASTASYHMKAYVQSLEYEIKTGESVMSLEELESHIQKVDESLGD